MNESKFWTRREVSAVDHVINGVDGFNSITIFVTSGGSDPTTIIGTLNLDGASSGIVSINTGETITLDAGEGKVLDGLTINTSSDSTTYLIARQ